MHRVLTTLVLILSSLILISSGSKDQKRYIYLWWDVVRFSYTEPLCNPSPVFKGLAGLRVSCKDKSLGSYILEKSKLPKNIVVIPAQSLFYRLYPDKVSKPKYLTVTWNDFSNGRKALESFNIVKQLDKQKQCKQLEGYTIILFRTSRVTMDGSRLNFAKDKSTVLPQEAIERITDKGSWNCFKRYEFIQEKSHKAVLILTSQTRDRWPSFTKDAA
jgi:hypothetical protein